ncbi:MAG: alpha/beta fold hydrolase [Acidobacteriota bacterium]
MSPSPHPSFAFLHGFGGRRSQWDEVRQLLGDPPALALALAGHEGPSPGNSFLSEVDRIALQLSQRGEGPWHLVGYSLGGRLALGLLARHRDLFAGATLLGAHPGLESEAHRRQRREDDEIWARRLEAEGIDAFFDAWGQRPLFAKTQSENHRAQLLDMRRGLDPAALAAALRAFSPAAMPRWEGALPGLPLPLTFVAGERDEKFVGLAQRMASLAPQGEAIVVPGAGHNVVLEAPEAVAQILRQAAPSRHPAPPATANVLLGALLPTLAGAPPRSS